MVRMILSIGFSSVYADNFIPIVLKNPEEGAFKEVDYHKTTTALQRQL